MQQLTPDLIDELANQIAAQGPNYRDELIAAVGVLTVILFSMWRMAVHYTGLSRAAREAAEQQNRQEHNALREAITKNGESVSRVGGKVDAVIEMLKKP